MIATADSFEVIYSGFFRLAQIVPHIFTAEVAPNLTSLIRTKDSESPHAFPALICGISDNRIPRLRKVVSVITMQFESVFAVRWRRQTCPAQIIELAGKTSSWIVLYESLLRLIDSFHVRLSV